MTDPLDYSPPGIEMLPDEQPDEAELRFVSLQAQNLNFHSEIASAFQELSEMFSTRNASVSEEAINRLMSITLSDDENSMPRFEPIEKKYENVSDTHSAITNPLLKSEDKINMPSQITLDSPTENMIQFPRFVSPVPLPNDSTFSPITKAMPSSCLFHAFGSTSIYKPKPQKSSEGLSSEMAMDASSTASLDESSEGSLKMDVADSDSFPTEGLPQYRSIKRSISPESSDMDDASKKPKK